MMDDLISRQAAIDALGERPLIWSDDDEFALGERNQYDSDILALGAVPPADVQPVKRGKWIYHDDDGIRYDEYWCSVCKKSFTVDAERIDDICFVIDDLKYCPNCGADMRGENDG